MSLTEQIPSYDFFHPEVLSFIARSSADGRRWVAEYKRVGSTALEVKANLALARLRESRIEQGRALLAEVRRGLDHLETEDPSILQITSRWYFSVLAYFHYLSRNLETADECLGHARDAIRGAIELQSILLPFAHHCADFELQRARIDRNRRRWVAVRAHIRAVREMHEGTRPYCVLQNGRALDLARLRNFYLRLALSREDRRLLRSLLDDSLRQFMVDRMIRSFFTRLGPVIPY